MTENHVERYIRTEKNRVQNLDELVAISHGMRDHDFGPATDGIPHGDAEEELGIDLEEDTYRSFEHLEEIDILEKIDKPRSPDKYTLADWRQGNDVFVMGEVPEAAEEGIERLIDHIQDDDPLPGDDSPAVADGSGTTVRDVVADEFNVAPDSIEATLRNGDPVPRLIDAVEAIRESDGVETRDDYDKIRFINTPKHYRLTNFALDLYQRDGW